MIHIVSYLLLLNLLWPVDFETLGVKQQVVLLSKLLLHASENKEQVEVRSPLVLLLPQVLDKLGDLSLLIQTVLPFLR